MRGRIDHGVRVKGILNDMGSDSSDYDYTTQSQFIGGAWQTSGTGYSIDKGHHQHTYAGHGSVSSHTSGGGGTTDFTATILEAGSDGGTWDYHTKAKYAGSGWSESGSGTASAATSGTFLYKDTTVSSGTSSSSSPNGSSHSKWNSKQGHQVLNGTFSYYTEHFELVGSDWFMSSSDGGGVDSLHRTYFSAWNGSSSDVAYSGDYGGGNGTRYASSGSGSTNHTETDNEGEIWSSHTSAVPGGVSTTTTTASGGAQASGIDDSTGGSGWEKDVRTTVGSMSGSGSVETSMSAFSSARSVHNEYHDSTKYNHTSVAVHSASGDGAPSGSGGSASGGPASGGSASGGSASGGSGTARGGGSFLASGNYTVRTIQKWSSNSGGVHTVTGTESSSYSDPVDYWGFGQEENIRFPSSSVFFGPGQYRWNDLGEPGELEAGPLHGPVGGTDPGPSPDLLSPSFVNNKGVPEAHLTPAQFNAALGSAVAVAQDLAKATSIPSTPAELGPLSTAVGDYAAHDMPVAKAPPLFELENEPPRQAQPNPAPDAGNLLALAGADEVDTDGKDAPKTPHIKLDNVSADERARAHELAILSHAAYGGGVAIPSDWQQEFVISPETSLDPNLPAGFRAVVFRNKKTGEYVLAFAGTKLTSYADLKTNAEQAEGILAKQYAYALLVVEKAKDFAGEKLTLTGHSLGGGLASAGAIKYKLPAVVFDPAGVHPNTVGLKTEDDIKKLKPDITVFRVKGEFLTTLQDSNLTRLGYVLPDTVGKKIVDLESDLFLRSIRPFGITRLKSSFASSIHVQRSHKRSGRHTTYPARRREHFRVPRNGASLSLLPNNLIQKRSVMIMPLALVMMSFIPSLNPGEAECDGRRPEDHWADARLVAFAKAICHNDLKELDSLIASDIDINAIGKEGMSFLKWALLVDSKPAFRRLLERGANAELRIQGHNSTLHMLAYVRNDSDWLRMALKHGANANVDNDPTQQPTSFLNLLDHRTPIYSAISTYSKENVVVLIDAGADINHRDVRAETPLLYAAESRAFEIVHYLLEAGADYRARASNGEDLAYQVVASSGYTADHEMSWREKTIEWLSDKGEMFDEAFDLALENQFDRKNCFEWQREAPERFKRWKELPPDSARNRRLRATARLADREHDAAIEDLSAAVAAEPRNAANYLLRARVRREKAASAEQPADDFAKALADVSAAIAIDPKAAVAYAQRADLQTLTGKHDESAVDYANAFRLDPANACYRWRQADAYLRLYDTTGDQKELDAALDACNESISLVRSARAYRARGDVLAAQGAYEKAAADYSEAIRRDPYYADAYAGRARVFSALGQSDRAVSDRAQAKALASQPLPTTPWSEFPRAIADLSKTIANSPDDPTAYVKLAAILAACPDVRLRDARKAVQLARKACELTGWNDPDALASLAAGYAQLEQFADAVAWQTKAIGCQASNEVKGEMRAKLIQFEFQKALGESTRAIEENPADGGRYLSRAIVRADYALQSGRNEEYAEAIADCDRALLLDPSDVQAFILRGKYRRGDFVKAIDDFTQAIRLDPECALAYAARGSALVSSAELTSIFYGRDEALKKYDRALEDLDVSLRLDATLDAAWFNRGNAWLAKRDYAKAAHNYARAVVLNPDETSYRLARANAYIAIGQNDGAIADCDLVLKREPKNREAIERRGDARLAKKDYGGAEADFRAAQAIDKLRLVWRASGAIERLIDDLLSETRRHPNDPRAYREAGLLFAACIDAKFRDGKKAVEYATKACELDGWKNPQSLCILAAACAEKGDFEEAMTWQTKALELAADDAPKDEYRRRLALYKRRQPFREARDPSDEGDKKSTTSKAPD